MPGPRSLTVGGRPFRNFEGGAGGAVPFAQDFAQSCNTAFVSLAPRLGAGEARRALGDAMARATFDEPAGHPPSEEARAAFQRTAAKPLRIHASTETEWDGKRHQPVKRTFRKYGKDGVFCTLDCGVGGGE